MAKPAERTTAPAAPAMGLRYIGDGWYIPGVPARDLTPDEAAIHAEAIAKSVAATGRVLYAPIEQEQEE